MARQRIVHLTPPRISYDHIGEKITCIRAHRERIFQVSTEQRGSQLIFNNYGHGGAGWTFLFGCVNASIRQFKYQLTLQPARATQPLAVIGAGCYGLLTAIMLKRLGHEVRIVADNLTDIPSHKAAGFFFPRPRKSSTPHERALFESYGLESYRTYLAIVHGNHPFITHGPQELPAYFGCGIDPGFSPYVTQGLMQAPEMIKIDFGADKQYNAMLYTTIFINPVIIMQELKRNVHAHAIDITNMHVNTYADLPESIIFNCAGLGAQHLSGDTRVIPVQGHLITLKNQPPVHELSYMINTQVTMSNPRGTPRDELIYFAPNGAGILGITFIRGQSSLTANHHEFDRLMQRCMDYFGAYTVDYS